MHQSEAFHFVNYFLKPKDINIKANLFFLIVE